MSAPRDCHADRHAGERLYRDASGAVEFRYCPRCGDRAYWLGKGYTPWADERTWRLRFDARRVFEALVAAAITCAPDDPKQARASMIRSIADWMGKGTVGEWLEWTVGECQTVIAEGMPLVSQFANQLVTGPNRRLLHYARARRSRFPRLVIFAGLVRDAVVTASARWLARWGS